MKSQHYLKYLLISMLLAMSTTLFASNEASTAVVAALPRAPAHTPTLFKPTAPNVDAKAYTLVDSDSQKTIAAAHAEERLDPASLTKLMTLYVISEALQSGHIHLNDKVTISESAWRTGGSRMFLKPGSQVAVADLIKGIIVASGNDACVAMSEYVAGSESGFADLMNQHAQRLGMNQSHFMNSTGLPDKNHYSTANDLAILAHALIRDFPDQYPWYKQKWFSYNGIRQPNRNRLLWWDDSVDGLKTGHTEEAGYCLVASALRHGMRLVTVVMGSPTDRARATASQQLLNFGYRFFETHKLYSANVALREPRTWKGREKHVAMGVMQDVYITIPNGQYNNVTASIALNDKNLQAPIEKGKTYGTITIAIQNKPYQQIPLVALDDNPKGNLWHRMRDSVGLTFHRLFG